MAQLHSAAAYLYVMLKKIMPQNQTVKYLRSIYLSPLFLLATILVTLNSGSMAYELSLQTLEQLTNFGTQEVTFEIVYLSMVKEFLPVSIGIWLIWILVLNTQYKVQNKTLNIDNSIITNIIMYFSLLIVGLSGSMIITYLNVDTISPSFKIHLPDLGLSGIKVIIFALLLYFLIEFQKKYFKFKNTISTVTACLALIFCSTIFIISLDYALNYIFA